jgi:hypothetical protein
MNYKLIISVLIVLSVLVTPELLFAAESPLPYTKGADWIIIAQSPAFSQSILLEEQYFLLG